MQDAPDGDVGSLKFLKTLVTTLMMVMIVGFIVLIGLLVTRFPSAAPAIALPDSVTLPSGATPVAFTQTQTWYAVVTDTNEILIFDRETGEQTQVIQVSVD